MISVCGNAGVRAYHCLAAPLRHVRSVAVCRDSFATIHFGGGRCLVRHKADKLRSEAPTEQNCQNQPSKRPGHVESIHHDPQRMTRPKRSAPAVRAFNGRWKRLTRVQKRCLNASSATRTSATSFSSGGRSHPHISQAKRIRNNGHRAETHCGCSDDGGKQNAEKRV